jgi:hypothetical protein
MSAITKKEKGSKRKVAARRVPTRGKIRGADGYFVALSPGLAEYISELGLSCSKNETADNLSTGIRKLAEWYRNLGSPHLREL